MSNALLNIQTAETKSVKEFVKINLGRVMSMLFNKRATNLFHSPTRYPLGLKDKMLMAFLTENARATNNTGFLERLHENFWQGRAGEDFSSNCDHRFEDLFLTKQAEEIQLLHRFWSEGNLKHIVEIGCCAGLHLQYLTTNLPGVVSAVGIDINPIQIQINNKDPMFDTRIKFVSTDGGEWLIENAKPETLFVTNGGVLEYFSQIRLKELFKHVSNQLAPSMFFTVEPIAADHDQTTNTDSIPFGEELSFSHNYRELYESTGFTVLHQHPVDFEYWRMMTTIAQTVAGHLKAY